MPKTPKGHKRPADAASNAVTIMKITTGEIKEALTEDGKNAAAVILGRRGGLARAQAVGKTRRAAIARNAAQARWQKKPTP